MAAPDQPAGAFPSPSGLEGLEARDAAGAGLGRVVDVYVDRASGAVRYLALDGEDAAPVRLVPVEGVRLEGGGLVLPSSADVVRSGPAVDRSGAVTRRVEEAVYAHYGRPGNWRREDAGRGDPELVAVRRRREPPSAR